MQGAEGGVATLSLPVLGLGVLPPLVPLLLPSDPQQLQVHDHLRHEALLPSATTGTPTPQE